MAAEGTNPPEGPSEDLAAALAKREQELAVATARASAMEETLQALRQPQQQAPPQLQPAPGKTYVIPPHIRQQIAAGGLAENEIDQNGDLIVPFIQAYLGQAAAEVVQMIQIQGDEIQMLHMLRDPDGYPHAETLFKEMKKIRDGEQKQGRYVNPDTAYRIAVANNYEKLVSSGATEPGQFTSHTSAPTASPVSARSRDASFQGALRTVRSPVTTPERPATTTDDLMSMSREERRAFFEQNGNTPVR